MILHKNEWKFWTLLLLFTAIVYAYPFYMSPADFLETYNGQDALFHLNRIEGIKESLLGGEFPVRVHGFQLNGYGTLDGVMYPDLFLYFPAVLRILGFSVASSWNIFWISLIISGVFLSFVGFTIWSQNLRTGAVASLFYLVSGAGFIALGHAVGDYPAFFALPLAIGSFFKILESEKYAKYWSVFVISFIVIFENHIITTLLLLIFIFVVLAFKFKVFKNKIQRQAIIKSAFFSCFINIWFAVPFAYFYNTISFHINDVKPVSLHTVTSNFNELFFSQFYLGIPLLIFLILCFFLKETRSDKRFLVGFFVYVFTLFVISEYFPWEWIEKTLPLGNFLPNFQYAIRFLPFGAIFLFLAMGALFVKILNAKSKYFIGITAFLIFAVSLYSHNFLPMYFGHFLTPKPSLLEVKILPSHRTENIMLQEDYLYDDVNFYQLRNEKGDYFNSEDYKTDAKISDTKKRGSSLEFSYIAEENAKIQIPLFYYEGYEAKDENGNKLDLNFGENRFMEVSVLQGEHRVKIHYAGFWFFKVFDVISLLTLIAFCMMLTKYKKD